MTGPYIEPLTSSAYDETAKMIARLLHEIEAKTNQHVFDTTPHELRANLQKLHAAGLYFVLLARTAPEGEIIGVITMYESFALYAKGSYGTIAELYVKPPWRSMGAGATLLEAGRRFAATKGWSRIEVTTPPIESFARTLYFYERNGFTISGGRKLKAGVPN